MNIKYFTVFLFCIILLLVIYCINTPVNLYSYNKYSYFDEVKMVGVGDPSNENLSENKFVYVKKKNEKLIYVYYVFSDVFREFKKENGLWVSIHNTEYNSTGEKCKDIRYSKYSLVIQHSFCLIDTLMVSSYIAVMNANFQNSFTDKTIRNIDKKKFEEIAFSKYNILNMDDVLDSVIYKKEYFSEFELIYLIDKMENSKKLLHVRRVFEYPFGNTSISNDEFLKIHPKFSDNPDVRSL